MQALTLHRPWDWAIGMLIKPVENRSWPCPPRLLGKHIAIHAGLEWSHEARGVISAWMDAHPSERMGLPEVPEEWEWPGGAIIAVARVHKCVSVEQALVLVDQRDAIWCSGPWCWLLDHVVALDTPVPAKGLQGLWKLNSETEARVREAAPTGFKWET